MLVPVVIAVCVVVLCVVGYNMGDEPRWDLIKKIPGPAWKPVLGNMLQMKTGYEWQKQVLQMCADYRSIGLFRLFLTTKMPRVFIFKPQYVEAVLSSTRHIEKSTDYDFLHPWLGTGLLTSTGDKWRHRRKMLTPAFHFNILQDFVEVFNQQSRILVTKLSDQADKGSFDVFHPITYCALDIICETAMGTNIDAQSRDTDYVKAVYRISSLVDHLSRSPWYWIDFIYNTLGHGKEQKRVLHTLHDFTTKIIKERLEGFDAKRAELIGRELSGTDEGAGTKAKRRLAFLDLLLYMSDNLTTLTMDDIREEVDTFMFEGHDTTAASMSWATQLIGAHPDVQRKVHEELDAIFGDSDRDATMEDLKSMKYLDCCIKEALRIFPSVPLFARRLNEDLQLGEFTIPKSTTALIITTAVHRDPDIFPDPETFQPERMLMDSSRTRHPYGFVPFSAGPRNCIGQKFAMLEEKTVLSHIFRRFHVESNQTREQLRPVGNLILRPETTIDVTITPRRSL